MGDMGQSMVVPPMYMLDIVLHNCVKWFNTNPVRIRWNSHLGEMENNAAVYGSTTHVLDTKTASKDLDTNSPVRINTR